MKPRILVVDDEAAIRDLLADYFREHGYEVATAADAAQAREGAATLPPDLVVLDLALGEGDGLELLGQFKTVHPGLPVVVLTGMGYDEDLLQEARQRGADGYLSKALPVGQLLMEVVRVLKYRRPEPPGTHPKDTPHSQPPTPAA
jgi:two-component system phosphate regulon response regulator OmpR